MPKSRPTESLAIRTAVVCTTLALASAQAASDTIEPTVTTAANASAWMISAQGLSGPARQLTPFPNYISVSSSGDGSGGSFAPDFDPYAWDGVWSASYSFSLPSDATAVQLVIEQIEADDKIVVMLNGSTVAGAAYVVTNAQGNGSMNFGAGQTPFFFPGFTSPVDVTSGFQVGAMNVITLVVNNTGSNDPLAPSVPLIAGVDGTTATFSGTLRYVSEVPEPATGLLMLFGFAVVGRSTRYRMRSRAQSKPIADIEGLADYC